MIDASGAAPMPSAAILAAAVHDGTCRAADLVAATLARIEACDPQLHCFVEVFTTSALQAAERLDETRRRGGTLGTLAGVPVAVKDNLLVAGQVAACGSRMLEHFRAPCSATAVDRLRALGAVIVGRTNMDEFGMGSSTERSAFGPTRNPWDLRKVPGGSSGGAAAAVAAGMCPLAVGSDTGGSVRQPAALCGVAGLKPTYGRISRSGLVAYASSLDCVGGLAGNVDDLALLLGIAGHDPADSTSLAVPPPDLATALASAEDPLRVPPARAHRLDGLRVGVTEDLSGAVDEAGIAPEVAAAVAAAIEQLRAAGARIVTVRMPHLRHAVAAYYLIAAAEASSNLARYDGVRYGHRCDGRTIEELQSRSRSAGFGAEVQLRILLGTFALQHGYHDEMYGQATRVRELLRRDFDAAFSCCDLLAGPTSPVPAFPLGSMTDDPVAMYRCDALTVPASLAGLPALSIPCGFTHEPLPIGLQLTAPALREDLLLRTARSYQQTTNWHLRRPPAGARP